MQKIGINQLISRAFPIRLSQDIETVITLLSKKGLEESGIHDGIILIDNEELLMPYRIYCSDISQNEEDTLSDTQKIILSCLLSRHYDGFIRHRAIRSLLDIEESYTVPFKVGSIGEYVIDIIQEIDMYATDTTIEACRKFAQENPRYWNLIQGRIGSYWGEYYSSQCPWRQYSGNKLMRKIKQKNT